MGKGKKSTRRNHKSPDAEAARPTASSSKGMMGGGLSQLSQPLALGVLGVEFIMGVVYIIIGSINVDHCKIEPMIPIWLIMMGCGFVLSAVYELVQYRLSKKRVGSHGRGLVPLIITMVLLAILLGFFVAGNVFVYTAWAEYPDYGHYWMSNGCDMGCFLLAFVSIIIMDVMVGMLVIAAAVTLCLSVFKKE